jgi:hypothetical protein
MIGRADLSDNKLAFDSKSLDGLKQSAKDNSPNLSRQQPSSLRHCS